MSDLLLRRDIIFGVTYELRVKYKIGQRNRYSEGRNDRQMTPRGYHNFKSYVKNLRVLVLITDRQTNRQTDRQMDRDINPVWASLTTFLQVSINVYLCTGFSQNTYAEDTSGYIVGTHIISY